MALRIILLTLTLLLLTIQSWVAATIPTCRSARLFGSHMVLQRDVAATLWGFASVGTVVNVTVAGTSRGGVTDETGVWRIPLPARPATPLGVDDGEVLAFSCSDGGSFQLTDVLWGDVLLASGQSNMCFNVPQAFNGSAEVIASGAFPRVRVMTADHTHADTPAQDLGGLLQPWARASPSSIGGDGNFTFTSAVGFFTARDLYEAQGGSVPIGLAVACVSGTALASWSSPAALARCPSVPVPGGASPSVLYNGIIHPFLVGPLALRGVLWYQGENDADNWVWYACGFPAFVADVRSGLGAPALPWAFVLLSAWVKSGTGDNLDHLPRTRLAQLAALGAPNVSCAPAYDLGDVASPWPGHPRGKQPVAARLAAALSVGAGAPAYASSAPAAAPSGALAVRVSLGGARAGGLLLRPQPDCPAGVPPGMCEGFSLQTSDGAWHPAQAALTPQGDALLLSVSGTGTLAANATRAMFANWPLASLYNEARFPVLPWLEGVGVARKRWPGGT